MDITLPVRLDTHRKVRLRGHFFASIARRMR
jgi:hypothetical protein